MSTSTGRRFRARPIRPPAEVVADLLVLDRVEAILAADRVGGLVPGDGGVVAGRPGHGEQVVDHRPEDPEQLPGVLGVVGEVVDVRPPEGLDAPRPLGDHPGDLERVVARWHHRLGAGGQLGEGPPRVDPEVVDDRLHRERQGVVEPGLDPLHDRPGFFEEADAALRGDEERHAAAGHPSEHQEAPEVLAEGEPGLADDLLGELVADPGDDPLDRPFPVRRGQGPERPDVGRADRPDDPLEDLQGRLAAGPLALAPEQIFLGDHVEDRPDVLRHPAVDEDQALRQRPMERGRVDLGVLDRSGIEDLVGRQESTAADPGLGVALAGRDPLDDLDAGEDPARVLPSASRPAQPFAEDRPGDDDGGFLGVERAGQVPGLAGGPHQDRDQGREQVGGDRQPRPLGDVVDLADDLQAVPGADDGAEQVGELDRGPFERGGDQARGDHAGLDQAEVVVAEVEQLVERGHVLAGVEVDAGQAEQRLGDHPDPGLDRGRRLGVAAEHSEVDRDVEDPGPFGVVHPEEEDVGPGGVRQVEPDRGPLDQDREEAVVGVAFQEPGVDPDRVLVHGADAEHPAVPLAAPDRPADLVGQGLVGDPLVGLGQGTGDRAVDPVAGDRLAERGDRLLEPPLHQVGEAGKRDRPAGGDVRGVLDPEPVDRMEEDRGADPLVEVPGVGPERFQLVGKPEDLGRRPAARGGRRSAGRGGSGRRW